MKLKDFKLGFIYDITACDEYADDKISKHVFMPTQIIRYEDPPYEINTVHDNTRNMEVYLSIYSDSDVQLELVGRDFDVLKIIDVQKIDQDET